MNCIKKLRKSSFFARFLLFFAFMGLSLFGNYKEQPLQSIDQIVLCLQSQLQHQCIADDVDLVYLAHRLDGSDCSTIRDMVKRALSLAESQAKKSKNKKSNKQKKIQPIICMTHFSEAIDDVLYGHHNKVLDFFVGFTLSEKIRAFHEAGHGLIGVLFLNRMILVDKITIAARGQTGGHCGFLELSENKSDSVLDELFDMYIVMLLAGGVAEQLSILKNIDDYTVLIEHHFDKYFYNFIHKSSIDSDLKAAKKILSSNFGMSHVDGLIKEYYKKTVELLLRHKHMLQQLAQRLMSKKTMYSAEIYGMIGVPIPLCYFQGL